MFSDPALLSMLGVLRNMFEVTTDKLLLAGGGGGSAASWFSVLCKGSRCWRIEE